MPEAEQVTSEEWEPTGHRIFITGYSGLVGYGIVKAALGKDSLIGFARGETANLFDTDPRVVVMSADMLDKDSLHAAIKETRPTLLLHLAGATDVDRCQRDPGWANKLNSGGTENLVEVSQEFGIPLIGFSTDYVYPRSGGPFSAEDEPSPLTDVSGQIVNEYGRAKLEGERKILGLPEGKRLILRISAPYDHRYNIKPGVPPVLVKLVREGRDIKAVDDGKNTYTYGGDIATVLNQLILERKWEKEAVIHIAGPEMLSALDIIKIIGKYIPVCGEITNVEQDIYFSGRAPRPISGGLVSNFPTRRFEDVMKSEILPGLS